MTQQVIENVVTRKPVKLPAALSNVMEVSQGFESPDPDSLRIVVTGRGGSGKTSFVASNPRCLLFDLERQPRTLIDPQATFVRLKTNSVHSADDLRKGIDAFLAAYRTDPTLRESIKTVAIDSFDVWVEWGLRELCAKFDLEDAGDYKGGHGKGYFKVRDDIFDTLDRIHRAGLGWVLVAHISLKEVGDVQVPALGVSKSFRDVLVRSRDLMFKIDCVPGVVEQKTKSGTVIKIPSKNPKDRRYVLITDTSTTAEDFDSPKCNVPVESGLVIPARGGWSAFRAAYSKAVDIRRNELEVK
jgi:hypothetical protein